MGLRRVWVWVCVVSMFISSEGWRSQGCLDQERSALLQLKHFFNSPYYLRDWTEGNLDCCQWERVYCNDTTGRVVKLLLSNTRNQDLGEWYLNASLFSSFEELERLSLWNNSIAGFVENEGFERLSHLNNLEDLDLSYNMFNNSHIFSILSELSSLNNLYLEYNQLNNSILSSLSGLSSLKELFIHDIGLKGTVDVQELDSLINLEQLSMGGNEIDKFVFPKGVLQKLNTLYLGNVSITDGSALFQSLGSFPLLTTVGLLKCNFRGTVTTHGELHNLTNIEAMWLYDSSLHVSLLLSIGAFTSLERIWMLDCELDGFLIDQDLPTFKNLKHLEMVSSIINNFDQMMRLMTTPENLSIYNCNLSFALVDPDLPTFKNLTSLVLHDTTINNNFVQIIKSMSFLETLSIINCINCGLKGTLSDQGICELLYLKDLYISQNELEGILPWCLANLTSLQVLDLSSNHFTGNIWSSPLKMLTFIKDLVLSDNHFQIPISLQPFFNHSKLKNFNGENNNIYGEIESHSLTPKFQLNSIILSGYGKGGLFPKFLYNQHDLKEVHLSHLGLMGRFPNWLLDNNPKLGGLYLANNYLSGLFQLPFHPHTYLKELDISKNSFCGEISIEVGAYLPSLESFSISGNAFYGSIPSSFGNLNSLRSLDLSHNNLTGEIPHNLAMGCFSLQLLVLSNNKLQGQIFSTNFNLTNLSKLQLDGNNFTGKIPDSLSNCSLNGLYLSDNHLFGKIPGWLGNLSDLVDLIMPNNHFEGPIPMEFCQLENLEVLDLSVNNMIGNLPSCFHPSSIKQVHLSRNKLQGQIKEVLSSSTSLVTLDIGYNHFDGIIPTWIGKLLDLTYLILSNNNIQGEVPNQLCHLKQLRLIDLSHNNLSGHIPSCLHINRVSTLNSSLPSTFAPGPDYGPPMRKEETVEFTTKNISYSYHVRILNYMSGIDLSCNKLNGSIPYQIGNLVGIHVLNLSHNNLTGPIPTTFSNLKEIESLDLSYNNLIGKIPPQLVDLSLLI